MADAVTRGLVIVNTGDGKGKTTAAFGLALRAAGQGLRVCIIQFVKFDFACGEIKALARFDDLVDIHTTGLGFIFKKPTPADIEAARKAWLFAEERLREGDYDVVILDELTYLIALEILPEEDILAALAARPPALHVVITGRGATSALIAAADLVTEMTPLKHPHAAGIRAQRGIEF